VIVDKCRIGPQPVWAAVLFDNRGSRHYAGGHTSAQATVAFLEREQVKRSERYAVSGYLS
jgi:hypothetical protein